MRIPGEAGRLATLWHLAWDDARLACVIYRANGAMQLKIESEEKVVMTQPFELQPRALARAHALGEALKRRGWRDAAS